MEFTQIRISKLEAARRQLDTAIWLWFAEKDPVAIHALAHAAHQIIHDINEKKGKPGEMLYKSSTIKPEFRGMVDKKIREAGNFFKHADTDPDDVVEFSPQEAEGHIMFSIMGLIYIGERPSDLAETISLWFSIHEPDMMQDSFQEAFSKAVPVEYLEHLKRLTKPKFLQEIIQERAAAYHH